MLKVHLDTDLGAIRDGVMITETPVEVELRDGYYLSRPASAQDLTAWAKLLPWPGAETISSRSLLSASDQGIQLR